QGDKTANELSLNYKSCDVRFVCFRLGLRRRSGKMRHLVGGRVSMTRHDPITQARIDLTAALRWASRHGFSEGICNHFSMVVPGHDARFLINPQGLHWSEITPADIVMTDATGRIIDGRHPVEPTAFYIHGRIHLGNPTAKVVLHTHMPYATALTTLQ